MSSRSSLNSTTQINKKVTVSAPTKKVSTSKTAVTKTVTVPVTKTVTLPAARNQSTVSTGESTRRNLSKIVNCCINPARCQAFLKKFLFDETLVSEIDSLRKTIKEDTTNSKVSEIKKQIKTLEESLKTVSESEKSTVKQQITTLTNTLQNTAEFKKVISDYVKLAGLQKEKIRVSSEVQVVLAAICEYLVIDLVQYCLSNYLTGKSKFLLLEHVVDACSNSKSYALIRNIPIYQSTLSQVLADRKRKEDAKLEKKLNKGKKKGKTTTETVVEPVTETSESEPEVEDTTESTNDTDFLTYIGKALDIIRKTDLGNDEKLRVANSVKNFLSELLIGFIHRIANIANVVVNDIALVRTLNGKHVTNIIKMIFIDEGVPLEEEFEGIRTLVDAKVDALDEYIKAEKSTNGGI